MMAYGSGTAGGCSYFIPTKCMMAYGSGTAGGCSYFIPTKCTMAYGSGTAGGCSYFIPTKCMMPPKHPTLCINTWCTSPQHDSQVHNCHHKNVTTYVTCAYKM